MNIDFLENNQPWYYHGYMVFSNLELSMPGNWDWNIYTSILGRCCSLLFGRMMCNSILMEFQRPMTGVSRLAANQEFLDVSGRAGSGLQADYPLVN